MWEKIKGFFIQLYENLVKVNGSPQGVALGFGTGVFLGILPLTGPLAALVVASVFKLNKAAALMGSVLTNTWLSVVTFVTAIKVGAAVLGLEWQAILERCQALMDHFTWKAFVEVSLHDVGLPLMVGYAITGFFCGLVAYVAALWILNRRRSQMR